MSLSFNEFQRELRKRNIDPNTAFILTLLYERLAEVMKGQEETATVVLGMAQTMQGFVQLSEANNKKMQQLARGQYESGVDVMSVANDPEDESKH